jgi:hypothetical protein
MLYTWNLLVQFNNRSQFEYPWGRVQHIKVELLYQGFQLLHSNRFEIIVAAHQSPAKLTVFLLSHPDICLLE